MPFPDDSRFDAYTVPATSRRTSAAEKVVVIIQARLRSTRLPAKVLLPLPTGRTVLHEVVERCAGIPSIHEVCVAVPDSEESSHLMRAIPPIASISRGPEEDVLARYHRAAVATKADIIVRVTSDCPLIDPKLCEQVIQFRKAHGLSYAYNNQPTLERPTRGTFPTGLDCEVFTAKALAAQHAGASAHAREHVTWDMRQGAIASHTPVITNPAGDFGDHVRDSSLNWSLDTIDDYIRICDLFEVALGEGRATDDYYYMMESFRGER